MDSRVKIALKFYDLKAEYLTPAVFVLILAIGFSSAFIPEELCDPICIYCLPVRLYM